MRFRLGMMVGFGLGYYLGTKAGRERYEQLNATIGKVRRSEVYEEATDKAKAVVDLTVERAKDFVEGHTPMGGHGAGTSSDIIAVPSPSS
jgi:hypothetical protein